MRADSAVKGKHEATKELEAHRPEQSGFAFYFFHFFFKSKYRGGMGRQMRGRFKREGICEYG